MKYLPSEDPRNVGRFRLDGTESVDEVAAAILAERERAATRRGYEMLPREYHLCRVRTRVSTSFRRSKFPKPRPGDGTVKHDKRVADAVALCEKHGAEFWALGADTAFVWGVKDGRYVQVWPGGIRDYGEDR